MILFLHKYTFPWVVSLLLSQYCIFNNSAKRCNGGVGREVFGEYDHDIMAVLLGKDEEGDVVID